MKFSSQRRQTIKIFGTHFTGTLMLIEHGSGLRAEDELEP